MAVSAECCLAIMKPIDSSPVDVSNPSPSTWNTLCSEVGTEMLLVCLFCAGFTIFRFATLRQLLTQKVDGKINKATLLSERGTRPIDDYQPQRCVSAPAADSASDLTAVSKGDTSSSLMQAAAAAGTQSQRKCSAQQPPQRTIRQRAPTAAAEANTSNSMAQAFIQRIRSAVLQKQTDKAMRALTTMASSGYAVPSGCVVAVVRLARESTDSSPDASSHVPVVWELPAAALSSDAVIAVLHFATRSSDILLLKETHMRAKQLGVSIPPAACEAILRTYAAAGDQYALEVFEELGVGLAENSIVVVVSACAESRHIRLAERCVAHARQGHGKLPLQLYTSLMKVYSHAKMFHKTCDLYLAMQKDNVEPDTIAYGCLIRAAVESGRHELARRLFQESGNPDLLNCMSLIRAAGRERDLAKAFRLLEELEKSPLDVDVAAYNCTLEVCAACGDRAAAQRLLSRMEGKGCVDVVSYNTFLKILFADGMRENVGVILEAMRKRGVYPNAVTYNSLVKAAVASHNFERAWQLTKEMEENGIAPDSFTCSILMKGVKHNTTAEDVDKVIGLIKRAKIVPDEVLVNCLLDACVRLRDTERLADVLKEFKSTGAVPSPHAYAMLIKSYGHARQLDRAWVLWREVADPKDRGSASDVAPSEEVFSSMVDACLACGDLAGAVAVLRQVRPHINSYPRFAAILAAVVKACVQSKRARLALDVYEEVKDDVQCTKVTYNTLIDALVRQDDLTRATDLFREMALQGVAPDLITYSTLIKGHCARGDLEQGLQLLGTMQRRGIMPDAILFNSILDGCAHKQMRTLTEQVLRDMEAAGVAPSNFTINILVKLYGRCGDLDAAFKAIETYPAKFGFEPNAQVYTCLMSACIANGALTRALEVHDTMNKAGCTSDCKTYQTLLSGCIRHGDLDSAIRLIDGVLCKNKGPHPSASSLDREPLEGVLMMAVRQGRGAECAAQLLERLQNAGVFISDRVVGIVAGRNEPEARPRIAAAARGSLTGMPTGALRPRSTVTDSA